MKQNNKELSSLIFGYIFILVMLVISVIMFLNYEHKISQSFKSYSIVVEQEHSIGKILRANFNRSLLLVRMANTDDFFAIDELNTKLHRQELIASNAILNLKKYSRPAEREHIEFIRKTLLEHRNIQEIIYKLLLENKQELALEHLTKTVFTEQRKVQSILDSFKKDYDEQMLHELGEHERKIKYISIIILLILFPVIVFLIAIALISIKKISNLLKEQQSIVDSLGKNVQERSKELILDKQLMHNLSEAIGVFDSKGIMKISNKKLLNIMANKETIEGLKVWDFLEKSFLDINTQKIKKKFKKKQHWQGEVGLLDHSNCYILKIEPIKRSKIDEKYYSIILTNISELKEIQRELEYSANFDSVTMLPNRRSYNRGILSQVINNYKDSFSILYLDLDNFKWVNDHHGHKVGDEFLHDFSRKALKKIKEDSNIYRIGGDEFIAIVRGEKSNEQLAKLSQDFIDVVKSIEINNTIVHEVGCSIGIASYPTDTTDVNQLLKFADYAMYHSKKTGKNKYSLFSNEMRQELSYMLDMEQKIVEAIKNKEFEVYYQPQYKLDGLKISGAETLLRWPQKDNKKETFIPPSDFIPLAEKFGLINELGDFVLEASMKQISIWDKKTNTLPKVAINVSSIQLSSGSFVERVKNYIDDYSLSPNRIDIEVTESVMMKDFGYGDRQKKCCLLSLQEKGLEVSIDDFGTGYSSLAYIKHLKVDRVKIDKKFIDDIEFSEEARAIIKAIIEMGHSLGLKVLAEGIETSAQLAILKNQGCDEGQGYLFNKALSAKEFERLCLADKEVNS